MGDAPYSSSRQGDGLIIQKIRKQATAVIYLQCKQEKYGACSFDSYANFNPILEENLGNPLVHGNSI